MVKPERYVLIKIHNSDRTKIVYRVFASWAGGYLNGDSWRMNSGVVKVEISEDHYTFVGYSGSKYVCKKNSVGFATSYTNSILDGMIKESEIKWNNLIEVIEEKELLTHINIINSNE